MRNILKPFNIGNFDLSPLPLDFTNELTTTKWLMKIQSEINLLIDSINNIDEITSNNFDEKLAAINKELEEIKNQKNTPVEITKITSEIQKYIEEHLYKITSFVSFGLENGHFVAYIPQSWNEIEFCTSDNGELILRY